MYWYIPFKGEGPCKKVCLGLLEGAVSSLARNTPEPHSASAYPPSYNWMRLGITNWIYPYLYPVVIIPLVAYPGSRILDRGSRTLDPGSRIQHPGSWILDSGSRILDPGSWILDLGSWIHDPGSWIQDPGSRILCAGSKIMYPGSKILDSEYGILDPGS